MAPPFISNSLWSPDSEGSHAVFPDGTGGPARGEFHSEDLIERFSDSSFDEVREKLRGIGPQAPGTLIHTGDFHQRLNLRQTAESCQGKILRYAES